MARVIHLKNGESEVMLCSDTEYFLRYLIAEYLGDDAAYLFDEIFNPDEPDGDDYEMISDGYLSMLHDAQEIFQSLINELNNGKQMNRKKLLQLAKEGYNSIHNNI